MGQMIDTIVDTTAPAGTNELHWIPRNLASGVYLYSMRAGNYYESKKMIFQK
jgi:hypothetical protein